LSVTVDANILIYASNEADPLHQPARALVQTFVRGPELLYLFWPTITAYLRIMTHPAILPRPSSAPEAAANITLLLARPHVRVPGEDDGFWELYRATAGDNARGNDVADAHIAALMRQHGVRTIYTRDRGFRRFDAIEMRDPFA